MHKKYTVVILRALAVVALVAAPCLQAEGAKKLSKADKKWLEEEVPALITSEEVSIFENLDADKDRQMFKELFWARRDPNPMTPENEFKEEFLSRVTSADRNFKTRGGAGSASDMGKIFVVLGPPQQQRGGGAPAEGGGGGAGSGGRPGGATPNAGAAGEEDPGGGGADASAAIEQGGDSTAVWTYAPNEKLGIPQGLTVEFRSRAGFGYRMVGSKGLDQALDFVKARYIFNPLINYARDEQGRLKAPPAQADPNSPAKKILQAMAETKTATPDVDFKMQHAFFRAAAGQVYVPLLLDVDGVKFTWEKDAADATVFGMVQNADGQPTYQFEEVVKLAREGDGRVVVELPIQLQPGKHTLFLGVRDNKNSAFGTQMIPLDVPDYNRPELVLSSVLFYALGKQVTESPGTVGHAFQFGQAHFTPKREMVYKTTDTLSAFFFVYGYGIDSATAKPNLSGQYVFYKDGARWRATKDEVLQANESQGVGNAEIPLSSFEPGNYKVEVRVTDKTSNKMVKQEVEFKVIPGGS